MIDFEVIGSGSSGNSVVLNHSVMVDAGLPYIKIKPYLDEVKLVLLTHTHQDHLKPSTVRRMALEKPKLRFGCGPFLAKALMDAGIPARQIIIMQPRLLYGFGICDVIPVELEHDVPCYGFKIHFPQGKVFYATDCANLNGISARGYQLYLVEANYQKDEIKARMDAKKAEGLFAYEQRVVRFHMSKEDCDNWLVKNMAANSEYVYLHCHEDKEASE